MAYNQPQTTPKPNQPAKPAAAGDHKPEANKNAPASVVKPGDAARKS
jgi:hypothetical protein